MYNELLSREKLVAQNVVFAFTEVEFGWFDTSIVVNCQEAYFFSFSDINEDLHCFVEWLCDITSFKTQSTIDIDCEREIVSLTLERLPKDSERTSAASLGLLWWYNELESSPKIQYCVVDIERFVAKTYMALINVALTKRFNILAYWDDKFMSHDDELSNSELDGYEFIEVASSPEVVSNRLQLLFFNKITRQRLNGYPFGSVYAIKNPEISDVIFLDEGANGITIRDLNGHHFNTFRELGDAKSIKLTLPKSESLAGVAFSLRKQLPESIAVFCSHFTIEVESRHPDVLKQKPFALYIPILIPSKVNQKNFNLNFFSNG